MTYISAPLRRMVMERAGGCCEYCRLSREDDLLSPEIDHIIAEKHGGATNEANLCLSCYRCNEFKGSDIASADPQTGNPTFLFHPRRQRWDDHFQLNGAKIEPLTPEGRVTVFLLQFNNDERVRERALLTKGGRYPCVKV